MVPPDGGSRILFFSGGTALAPVAAELSRHTRNAVHVITTFDSGGSSAELRRAFDMPAVGDIRARIMALADRSLEGNPEIVELLGYRLPKDAGPEALHRELASLASGAHPLVAAIPEPMNEVVTQHLSAFRSLMPVDMDLAGASIGNLILTSGYLSLDRQLEPVVRVFSGMVQARGVVMPVADSCAHLCVRLENGEVIVGQHRFTGKTATADQAEEVCAQIRKVIGEVYGEAVAEAVTVQYGGSMNAKNCEELLSKKDVDGGLIGGASLKAPDFAVIVNAASNG